MIDYQRISTAISYIKEHSTSQPSLEDIAAQVHLSPFHFQRLFKEWAGVSPKKFLQYISVEHARRLLENNHSVADVTFETGLSGTGRLHDLFVSIEAMTPGEFKNGGKYLKIDYVFSQTPFGQVVIAATSKGVCKIDFIESKDQALLQLNQKWPHATFTESKNIHHQPVIDFFNDDWEDLSKIKLHLQASPFQLRVWEALLKIPAGNVTTYASLAENIGNARASRAVGTAVGQNPVAYLVPCHRVIRATGIIGEYRWGSNRKVSMIGWEQCRAAAG